MRVRLIALEFLAIPYPMATPGYHIPFYEQVAQEPGHFAILELPLRPMSDYMAYQTVHGKPIVYGYLSRQPPDPFVEGTPALHYLLNSTPARRAAAAPRPPRAPPPCARRASATWSSTGGPSPTPEAAAMQAKLAALFPGQAPEQDPADQMAIYLRWARENTSMLRCVAQVGGL